MSTPNNRVFTDPRRKRDLLRSTTRLPALPRRSHTHVAVSWQRPVKHSWKTAVATLSAVLLVIADLGYYQPWHLGRSAAAESHLTETPRVVTVVSPTPAPTSNVVL